MKPLAILTTYQEADILPWTLRHLARQGCDVAVIDCQSTDGTRENAAREHAALIDAPAPPVAWFDLLSIVEDLARAASRAGRWIIHCDADELRYSGVPGQTLSYGLDVVWEAGYNAVDHRVYTFHPVAPDLWDGTQDPEEYFRYYSGDPLNQRIGQVKAWRHNGGVSLSQSGGHQAQFAGRRVYPIQFVLKHYPIRSQAHGERKVFRERQWLDQAAGRKDWHVQYQGIAQGHSFLKDPATLRERK